VSDTVRKTIEVRASLADAWRAFTVSAERSKWEAQSYDIDPRPGGHANWSLPGYESLGEVVEVIPEKLLRQREASGPHGANEIRVEFEPIEEGTRISITHTGLPAGMEASVAMGWGQALADLVVLLERGVPAGRFVSRLAHAGVQIEDTPGGIEVTGTEPGGFAEALGLRPGDLLLAIDRVPVYTRPELWVMFRHHTPGEKIAFALVRDGSRIELSGVF